MAAIDDVVSDNISREEVVHQLWLWINTHGDDQVFTVKVWVVRKTFYVRDLHVVFERLLGPDPTR